MLTFNYELPCQYLKALLCHATVSRTPTKACPCQQYKAFSCQAGRRIQTNTVTRYLLFYAYFTHVLRMQTHITVFNTLSVSCERVVRVSAPKWLKSCGGSQITTDLVSINAFQYTRYRKDHPSFPYIESNMFSGLYYRDLHHWMTDKVKYWGSIISHRHSLTYNEYFKSSRHEEQY